jgi:hypothetical protein
LKQPKFAKLDKVFYKWFIAMCSEQNPMNELLILEKAESFLMKWIKLTRAHSLMAGYKI